MQTIYHHGMTAAMNEIDSEGNRRDYFRLDDEIHLIKRPIERHMLSEDPYSEIYRVPRQAILINQLRAIEADSHHLLSTILDTQRAVGQYLKALDQKIECLSMYMIADAGENHWLHKEPVSISEGGITFYHDYPLQVDDNVHLTMVLFPSHASLCALGQVRSIQPLDHHPRLYRIGVEFTLLLEADRKQLARHIRRKQSLELRSRHEDG
jgi:hypothetical protein